MAKAEEPGDLAGRLLGGRRPTSRARLARAAFLTLAACMALSRTPGSAQVVAPLDGDSLSAAPGSHLEVFLMTMGPGEAIWERFSHNALVIRDDLAGTEIAYNWGIFDFNQADFIPRLARGRMRYWMAGYRSADMIEAYRRAGRSVWMQRVNLTPSQRLELQAYIRETDTEANRYYRYDYYRDNCSTRVRDALDLVLDGRIRAATEEIATGTTYRWHTSRLLGPVLPAYAGIQFVVGNRGDEPISAWDEMFLPLALQRHLGDVRIDGPDGELPLLGPSVQVVDARQEPVPSSPPNKLLGFLLAGGLLGGLFAVSGLGAGRGRRWAVWLLVLAGGAWSLISGLLGSALILSWCLTDHYFWGLNENALQASPVSLALAGLLLLAATGRARVWAGRAAVTVGALALAGLVLQILPGWDQVNGEILALTVPAQLGLTWGTLKAWPSAKG